MLKLSSFLFIDELPENYRHLSRKYGLIQVFQVLTFAIIDTYLVLFLLDFISFGQLGLLLSIKFIVLAFLDYPTGALGDYLGQDRVLQIAYICITLSALILVFSTTFEMFIAAFVLVSIGQSQESGALQSWFDNEYIGAVKTVDPNRQIFGAFKGRLQMITSFVSASAFVVGGIASTSFGERRIVLVFHLIFAVITFVLIRRNVKTRKTDLLMSNPLRGTLSNLVNGVKFGFSSRGIFFLYLGTAITWASVWSIWFNILLFPYYFSYSFTDFAVGVLRSSNFLVGLVLMFLVTKWSRNIKAEYRTLFWSNLYANPVFILIAFVYFILVPPPDTFNLWIYLGVIVIFQTVGWSDVLSELTFNRIQLNIVPDDIRNSVYSLIPSITTLFAVPFSFVGGLVVTEFGFEAGIMLVLVLSFTGSMIMLPGLILLGRKK